MTLSGEPLECTVRRQDSRIEVSFRNVIESPLRIRQMEVTLRSGSKTISARVEGLMLPWIWRQGRRPLSVTSATPLGATDEAKRIRPARSGSGFRPGRDLERGSGNRRPAPVREEDRCEDRRRALLRPEPRVSLIRVNLQRGGGPIVSVDLTEQQLATEALLSSPLRDYVLGRADPGVFQYQVLTVRGGMRTPTSAWRESSTNLIITTEDLA